MKRTLRSGVETEVNLIPRCCRINRARFLKLVIRNKNQLEEDEENHRSTEDKMRASFALVLLVVVAVLIEDSDCWGRRRRRRRRRSGGWGISNGGVTYTFGSGTSVTGHGSPSNGGSVGVKVSIPFGRKRRAIEGNVKPTKDVTPTPEPTQIPSQSDIIDNSDIDQAIEEDQLKIPDVPDITPPDQPEKDDNCEDCLEIEPFNINDKRIENKTIESNQFVMVVKFIEENMSAVKLDAKIKFEVIEVVKSPLENVKQGETFTIKAQMASCPCLTSLNPGYYVVTGSIDANNQLVLSNVLMEFEN